MGPCKFNENEANQIWLVICATRSEKSARVLLLLPSFPPNLQPRLKTPGIFYEIVQSTPLPFIRLRSRASHTRVEQGNECAASCMASQISSAKAYERSDYRSPAE